MEGICDSAVHRVMGGKAVETVDGEGVAGKVGMGGLSRESGGKSTGEQTLFMGEDVLSETHTRRGE